MSSPPFSWPEAWSADPSSRDPSSPARSLLHVAGYRFVALPDAAAWRDRLEALAASLGLRGTVLVAEEGINLCLAGPDEAVDEWLDALRAEPRFDGLPVHRTRAAGWPYARLRVKHKAEIIRMNRPAVRPERRRAPAVAPETLVRWLNAGHDDAGRELVLLDTRNAFEVAHGRFRGAVDWSLQRFSDFPAAAQAHRAELRDRTVISYCTGGIRCEKATLVLHDLGMTGALQLDGGILNHFHATGGAHFEGDCFVFDDRLTLDTRLTSIGA